MYLIYVPCYTTLRKNSQVPVLDMSEQVLDMSEPVLDMSEQALFNLILNSTADAPTWKWSCIKGSGQLSSHCSNSTYMLCQRLSTLSILC